jgi:retron-type reverse transcriptase
LYPVQFGFRPGHSTEHAVLETIEYITTEIELGKIPINIFLDLTKAFDTTKYSFTNYPIMAKGIKH